jgi:hypothetical protein
MYDEDNETQPCCGACGHPISCGCGNHTYGVPSGGLYGGDPYGSAYDDYGERHVARGDADDTPRWLEHAEPDDAWDEGGWNDSTPDPGDIDFGGTDGGGGLGLDDGLPF